MSLGYARCARILDELYQAGVIGPVDGASPREILVTDVYSFLQGTGTASDTKTPDFSDYKVPKIVFSKTNSVPWGKPLSELKLQKFEIPLGFTDFLFEES